MEKAKAALPDVRYCDDPYQAVKGAEALLVLTEWEEFETADLERVRSLMERPLMIDGRNVFPPEKVASCGLQYVSLGRAQAAPEPVAN
jgi:UDPglucose 6-dehydrogenase